MVYQRKKRTHEQQEQLPINTQQNSLFASPDLETDEAENSFPVDISKPAPSLEVRRKQASQPGYNFGSPVPATKHAVQRQSRSLLVQAKLTVGPVGDKYEQEADRVASQVVDTINIPTLNQPIQRNMAMPPQNSYAQRILPIVNSRRMETNDENMQMKPRLQTEKHGEGAVSKTLESEIQHAKGNGQALDHNLKHSMGQAMGADFSKVKIHTDAQSDQLNKSIQAKAFTTGSDLFFRKGSYDPVSRTGQKLIAHELTHVVQQVGHEGQISRQIHIQREPYTTVLHNDSGIGWNPNGSLEDDGSYKFELDDFPHINLDQLQYYDAQCRQGTDSEIKDAYVSKGDEEHYTPVIGKENGMLQMIYVSRGSKLLTIVALSGDAAKLLKTHIKGNQKMSEGDPEHVSSHRTHPLGYTHTHTIYSQKGGWKGDLKNMIKAMEDTPGVLTKKDQSNAARHTTAESWDAAREVGEKIRVEFGLGKRPPRKQEIQQSELPLPGTVKAQKLDMERAKKKKEKKGKKWTKKDAAPYKKAIKALKSFAEYLKKPKDFIGKGELEQMQQIEKIAQKLGPLYGHESKNDEDGQQAYLTPTMIADWLTCLEANEKQQYADDIQESDAKKAGKNKAMAIADHLIYEESPVAALAEELIRQGL